MSDLFITKSLPEEVASRLNTLLLDFLIMLSEELVLPNDGRPLNLKLTLLDPDKPDLTIRPRLLGPSYRFPADSIEVKYTFEWHCTTDWYCLEALNGKLDLKTGEIEWQTTGLSKNGLPVSLTIKSVERV